MNVIALFTSGSLGISPPKNNPTRAISGKSGGEQFVNRTITD